MLYRAWVLVANRLEMGVDHFAGPKAELGVRLQELGIGPQTSGSADLEHHFLNLRQIALRVHRISDKGRAVAERDLRCL